MYYCLRACNFLGLADKHAFPQVIACGAAISLCMYQAEGKEHRLHDVSSLLLEKLNVRSEGRGNNYQGLGSVHILCSCH